MILYFIKLNIYSILLTIILTLAVIIEFKLDVLCNAAWKIIVFGIVWGYVAIKTLKIYAQFPRKLATLHRLVATGREKYDFRLFYPYMRTPCMRNVVYFSLCELNCRKDYKIIRHNFRTRTPDTYDHTPARTVRTVHKNGVLQFEVKSDSGQWEIL